MFTRNTYGILSKYWIRRKRDLNDPCQNKEWLFYEFTAQLITLYWHLLYHLDSLKQFSRLYTITALITMLHWAVTCALAKNFLLRNCSVHCHQAITWGLNNRGTCSQKLLMWKEWQLPHKKPLQSDAKVKSQAPNQSTSLLLNDSVRSQFCKHPGNLLLQCCFTEVLIRIDLPNLGPSYFLHKDITHLSHSRILHFLAIKKKIGCEKQKGSLRESQLIISFKKIFLMRTQSSSTNTN